MRLANYVADFIASISPRVYGVVGAGAMHLNDAICHHHGIEFIAMHHEQAAAMAAEADARVTNKIGVVHVTAGPGGTNALTGVACAYVDSIPMLVIAGQVTTGTMSRDDTRRYIGAKVRQLGTNELPMVDLMRPVTKRAVTLIHPNNVRYELELAVHTAWSGRKGPVFIEIPLDVQGADVDVEKLDGYTPIQDWPSRISQEQMLYAFEMINASDRPLLIVGNGIHLSGGEEALRQFAADARIPIVTSWNGSDLLQSDHGCVIGRPGVMGDRAGNFAVQNCDLLIVVGTRLSIPQTGHAQNLYAPNARKIVVDIDDFELRKPVTTTTNENLLINGDAAEFLRKLRQIVPWDNVYWKKRKDFDIWRTQCLEWKNTYPVMLPEYRECKDGVNSYAFIEELGKHLPDDAIVVTDAGTAFVGTMQSLKLNGRQRLMYSSGVSPMGWGLPAAIGAAKAGGGRRVICICGDGGIMMNLQELATIAHHNLPISIFVLCNDGYLTMRQTQNAHFGRESGASKKSGIRCPQFLEIAYAMGMTGLLAAPLSEVSGVIESVLDVRGPVLCEVHMPRDQILAPRLQTKLNDKGEFILPAFDDMWPHLPPDELARARGATSMLEAAE